MGLFDKLKQFVGLQSGLTKTRTELQSKVARISAGRTKVDDAFLDDLEEALITSDVGVPTTLRVVEAVEARGKTERMGSSEALDRMLKEELSQLLLEPDRITAPQGFDAPLPNKPHVIMVVGVNGVGKTTTIGKLASNFKAAGKGVVIGAADTFRAAATEQLEIWAERAGVPIISRGMGTDPSAVVHDTLTAAVSRGADVVLIDTAGRLHNKTHLMAELHKMSRVMDRFVPGAPHEVLLVLDASTGQNALSQAKEFTKSVPVTALALTKLDGTAKGGIVIAISNELNIPVKYIGVGEKIEDLQLFDRRQFVQALFEG